jgi:hypothetical protein
VKGGEAVKIVLGLLGLVALALFLKSELPAMKRYIKIERM